MDSQTLIAGRYRLTTSLGSGAMGSVFRAVDETIRREVAIKLIAANLDPMLTLREAQTAGRLNHPNIVTIYDVGHAEDGRSFIAMEFVDGATLDAYVTRRHESTLLQQLILLEQLCAGLSAAHNAGVVHRDLKPTNLMVLPEPMQLKIVDFSIARGSGLTTLVWGGTAGYMPPEQRDGHQPDERSDIFAACVVAFELIGGRRAFPHGVPPTPLDRRPWRLPALSVPIPEIGTMLDALVAKGTAVQSERRYQRAEDVAIALRAIRRELEARGELGTRAWAAAPGPPSPPVDAPVADVRTLLTEPPSMGTSRRVVPAVVAAGVLALAIGWWALGGRGEPPKPEGGVVPEKETVEAPLTPDRPVPPPGRVEGPRRPTGQSSAGTASPAPPAGMPAAPPAPLNPVSNVGPANPADADGGDANKPPTPASPASLPPADPAAAGASDVANIQQVIDAFAQAHRGRSSATLKMLQPSLTAGELAVLDRTFAESDDYDFKIIQPQATLNGNRARVRGTVVRRIGINGAPAREVKQNASFELQRLADGTWVLISHTFTP